MAADGRAVSDIGEQGLLALLSPRLTEPPSGSVWSGDDAALVDVFGGRAAVTTDVIVEDVDFRLDTFGPSDIGWKAMAINVSDIAAMGATPLYALATISLHGDSPVELFEGVADGLFEAAETYGVYVIGGDISRARELSVGVTLIGIPGDRPVTRDGAKPGDAICVTGELGGAAGGLIALDRQIDAPELIERQRRPRARVQEGRHAANAGATAMIDLSDGLAMDLGHVVRASGVGCEVDLGAVPVDRHLGSVDEDPIELAITGGEDFELLFTIPDATAVEGIDAFQIGVVTDGEARIGERPLSEWRERSWDHLRNR
jgi:thiamine-monophosphate kinase